ncbi:MAG: Ig-like domain repeat protein [bacterium]
MIPVLQVVSVLPLTIRQTSASELVYEELPSINVFSSKYGPGNNRRFLAVGDFYDAIANAYYGRSESYLKFDLNLPKGSIILSAELSLKRYANAGSSFTMKVGKLVQDISSTTGQNTGDYKNKIGEYGSALIDSGNLDFKDYSIDITNLTKEWINNSSNYGLSLYSDENNNNRGAAFCSTRNDNFCISNNSPKIKIKYTVNQPPNIPVLVSPINNYKQSGKCDESTIPPTGICRNKTKIDFIINNLGDPDPAPGDYKDTIIAFSGANNFNTATFQSPNIQYSSEFADGVTHWKAVSKDNLNAITESNTYLFTTDTTPPNIPIINTLPQYSSQSGNINPLISVEVSSHKTLDNVASENGISYYLEYSENQDFQKTFYKPWQSNSTFQLGYKGADNIENTDDDLLNEHTYFFRIKAKDSEPLNDGNVSNWSETTSTTIDAVFPVIKNFKISDTRFSPENLTSSGVKDSTTFTFNYDEKNPDKAYIKIYKDKELIKILTQDISITESNNISLSWDGKNDSEFFTNDGLYTAYAVVNDKAGNATISNGIQVIVDNSGANITINSPQDNFYTNKNSIEINGQVTVPRLPDKEDKDINNLEINLDNNWVKIPFDENYFFYTKQNLNEGENIFKFKTVDTVDNKIELSKTIISELDPPTITEIRPSGLINNRKPEIKFTINDSIKDKLSSGIPVGVNPYHMKVWLTYDSYQNNEKIIITKELINNGVNLDNALLSDLNCIPLQDIIIHNSQQTSQSAECNITFLNDLQPDSNYTVYIYAEDVAGNSVQKENAFKLDSYVYSEISSPVNNAVYSSSSILIKGKTSLNSEIKINNKNLNKTKTFILNNELNGTGMDNDSNKFITSNFKVNCKVFPNINFTINNPDEEICDWEVSILQDYSIENIDVVNNNLITVTDDAENSIKHEINITINLYKFNVVVSADSDYFSPNGDGIQDGLIFNHYVENSTDKNSEILLQNYNLKIRNEGGIEVKNITGNNLPRESFYDGKDNMSNWLPDGNYTYSLEVKTLDGISISTEPHNIYARTNLKNDVILTSPKNGLVTTRGVISVQGLAPSQSVKFPENFFRGHTHVDICVDTEGTSLSCDLIESVDADLSGNFSTLVVLPRTISKQSIHYISATARDEYGNATEKSNVIRIIQDTVDPFNYVKVTPALTGINTKEDYENFLQNKISINKLRTVFLSSSVTQNTEKMQINYSNKFNLKDSNYIATLNDFSEDSMLLNPFSSNSIKKNHKKLLSDNSIPDYNCGNPEGCLWEYYLPIYPDSSGIYEIEFTAKKGDTVQTISAGFKADGAIPASPYIMILEKWDDEKSIWVQINSIDEIYYTNKSKLRIRGAAEPNSMLKLVANDKETNNEFHTSEFGTWEYVINDIKTLSLICGDINSLTCTYGKINIQVSTVKKDNEGNEIYNINSTNSLNIIYDIDKPNLININRNNSSGYVQTGTEIQYSITSNEKLLFSDLIKEDGFIKQMTNSSNNKTWTGSINIDRKNEGAYYPQINIKDYAGNVSYYDSKNLFENKEWNVFIDNSKPDSPLINKEGWGIDDGIKADGIYPELGRTNPHYVIKSNHIALTGKAEKNQLVKIFINNQPELIKVGDSNCFNSSQDLKAFDGLIVKFGAKCDWNYTYFFPDNGENDIFGVPIHSYLFQFQTQDLAGNNSEITSQEIIYHDTLAPQKVDILNITSKSYNPVPYISTYLTKDNSVNIITSAERFSDMEFSSSHKNIISNYRLIKNSSDRKLNQQFSLGTLIDEGNCIQNINGRKIGICEDGIYKFTLTSTDAAGNKSITTEVQIERDTVAPDKPDVELLNSNGKINAKITGEPNSNIYINNEKKFKINNNGNMTTEITQTQCGKNYTFTIQLIDGAGNISESTTKSITTEKCISNVNMNLGRSFFGSADNYYGGKTMSDLGNIEISINYNYTIPTADDMSPSVQSNIPPPIITYMTINQTKTEATIYGVAVNKNAKAKFKVKTQTKQNTKCNVIFIQYDCNEILDVYSEMWGKIDHAGLGLYEERAISDQDIGFTWNDEEKGQWSITIQLNDKNKDINIGDMIYAKSQLWGVTPAIPYGQGKIIINYSQNGPLVSDKSNVEKLGGEREMMMRMIKWTYDIEMKDGDKDWSEAELQWTAEALEGVPNKIRSNNSIKNIARKSHGVNSERSCTEGEKDLTTSGCFDGGNTLWIYDAYNSFSSMGSKYGNGTKIDEGFKINLIHEIAHSYSKSYSEVLNNFKKISWNNENDIKENATFCDFITSYAMKSYSEDFSETYGVYYVKNNYFFDYHQNNNCEKYCKWNESDLKLKKDYVQNN